MPIELERKLKKQVAGRPMTEKQKNAYVYGTMRKTGWVPSTQTNKGKPLTSPKI